MITITPDNFHSDILSAPGLSLVMFGADWCIPSRQMLDIFDEIEPDYPDLTIGTVNIETEVAMMRHWVMRQGKMAGSPTLILFHKGEPVASKLGVGTEEAIRDWLDEHMLKIAA